MQTTKWVDFRQVQFWRLYKQMTTDIYLPSDGQRRQLRSTVTWLRDTCEALLSLTNRHTQLSLWFSLDPYPRWRQSDQHAVGSH